MATVPLIHVLVCLNIDFIPSEHFTIHTQNLNLLRIYFVSKFKIGDLLFCNCCGEYYLVSLVAEDYYILNNKDIDYRDAESNMDLEVSTSIFCE